MLRRRITWSDEGVEEEQDRERTLSSGKEGGRLLVLDGETRRGSSSLATSR